MLFASVINILLCLLYTKTTAVFTSQSKIEWISVHLSEIILDLKYHDGIEAGWLYTYICRAAYDEGVYAGKLVYLDAQSPRCNFGKDGNEMFEENFEVLSAPEGSLSWEEYDGKVPQNAIISGDIAWEQRETTYVCRGWANDEKTILVTGYHTGSNVSCNVPFNIEHQLSRFEILVKNGYGIRMNY